MSILISVGVCHPAPCSLVSAVSAATGAVRVDQGMRRKSYLEETILKIALHNSSGFRTLTTS